MNVMEAIKIKKTGGIIKRKLANGLTEVKEFYYNGQLAHHYFLNENGNFHGKYKWWWSDGNLGKHSNYKNGKRHGERKWWFDDETICYHDLWEDDKLIKDYLA